MINGAHVALVPDAKQATSVHKITIKDECRQAEPIETYSDVNSPIRVKSPQTDTRQCHQPVKPASVEEALNLCA